MTGSTCKGSGVGCGQKVPVGVLVILGARVRACVEVAVEVGVFVGTDVGMAPAVAKLNPSTSLASSPQVLPSK